MCTATELVFTGHMLHSFVCFYRQENTIPDSSTSREIASCIQTARHRMVTICTDVCETLVISNYTSVSVIYSFNKKS